MLNWKKWWGVLTVIIIVTYSSVASAQFSQQTMDPLDYPDPFLTDEEIVTPVPDPISTPTAEPVEEVSCQEIEAYYITYGIIAGVLEEAVQKSKDEIARLKIKQTDIENAIFAAINEGAPSSILINLKNQSQANRMLMRVEEAKLKANDEIAKLARFREGGFRTSLSLHGCLDLEP